MSSVRPSSRVPAPKAAVLIADRYRLERLLGHGGMGEVASVVEEATGQRFALKRLLPGAKPKHVMLLQREFHTLVSLNHPNVVHAFDYGSWDGVPYYTMELLAGSDVEALAPLPWREVVPILRDVASALSLMHARQLVHRDVSARNVWKTPNDEVKLIDFGALANFGESSDVAGTPPYVAPEALRTHVLDQRTDLYSLGALAYFLLTARHAVPARSLGDLEQHWRNGFVSPRAQLAAQQHHELEEIPERLEQLIDALLAHEPLARPASAAEVLDRLELILPGTSVVSKASIEGVLASKVFVGRAAERARIGSLLKRSSVGTGASVALLGPRGIGLTRLLSELALDARVAGATVVELSGDNDKSTLSAAGRATSSLLRALPTLTRKHAAPHAAVLGLLSSELQAGLEVAELEQIPLVPGEARVRLQSALLALWQDVSSEQSLVVLLGDLQDMDEASAAFFATLGREVSKHKLLLVAGVRSEQEATIPVVAQPYVARSVVLALSPLTTPECAQLLRSVFGEVEHLTRTAQRLGELAEGNPGRLVELCEHLVRSEAVHCSDGYWVLPQEIETLALPATRELLDEARLDRLSDAALSFAAALSVVEGGISLTLCSALAGFAPEGMFAALAELSGAGVLLGSDAGYRFRHDGLRGALAARLNEKAAQAAHLAAGEELLRQEDGSALDRLSAGVHLLRAGQHRRGAQLVNEVAGEVSAELPEERSELARQFEQALGMMRTMVLNDHELMPVLSVLAMLGYFVDRRLGLSYGDEALQVAQRVCKMDLARRLRPWFGRTLGLYIALIVAGVGVRRAARKSVLVSDFATTMRMLFTVSGSLSGMYALCIARDKVLTSIDAIEPMTALGKDHIASIVYEFGMGCAGTVGDRLGEARARWSQLIARLDDPRPIKQLKDHSRAYYWAASMYAWGATECWRDKSQALEIADRLEQQPLKMYHLSADQLRSVYHAQQGDVRKAAHYRERVAVHALQRGMTWQAEIWEPSSSVSISSRQVDAMAVKRAAGQLSVLSQNTPSLSSYVESARASYSLLRGRHAEALSTLLKLKETRDPELVGTANMIAQLAQAYNGLNQFAEAEAVAREALSQLRDADLAFPAMTLKLQIELALAEAGLGKEQAATARIDALLAEHEPNRGPLTLGALHEARASIALRFKHEQAAQEHVEAMERWYRGTDCPALVQHCDRIAKRWAKGRARADAVPFLPSMTFLAHVSSKLTGTAMTETPEWLLGQLVRGAVAAEGALFVRGRDRSPWLVKSREGALPPSLQTWVEQRMDAELAFVTETDESDEQPSDPNLLVFGNKAWRLSLLTADQGGTDVVVGALVLCNAVTVVPSEVLQKLADSLATGAFSAPITRSV